MQLNPRSADAATLEADAVALHAAVSQLVRVYQYRDRDRICCHDLSVTQCHALEALIQHGPLRSLALAQRLNLDKSTVSRVVDALERKGYVRRRRDPEDARAQALSATRAGRELYQTIERGLIAQQAELIADLEPEVRAAAASLIRRLARAAEARLIHGENRASDAAACALGSSCG